MALFWSKKSKAEKNYDTAKTVRSTKVGSAPKTAKAIPAVAKKQGVSVAPKGNFASAAADAIIRPHITEKSGILSQNGSYTFVVAKGATKASISKAVAALYKITPVKVAVLNQPSRQVIVKGRHGIVSGYRKAIVTVKKGDKIDFL